MKKYENYVSNLNILVKAEKEDLENEFIISGIIDKFMLQFELGWKVMKEFLRYEGSQVANTGSPREIIKAAYSIYSDYMEEDVWIEILRSRNNMTHIYDGNAAKELVSLILSKYVPAFIQLQDGLNARYGDHIYEIDNQ